MALIARDTPKGIDYHINKLQSWIYTQLLTVWGNVQYESHPRCYRNRKKDGFIAELYKGSNEYKEVYWDDKFAAMSFFGIGDSIKVGVGHQVDVHLVFFVNLKKVKTNAAYRADNEVRTDVVNIINQSGFGFKLNSVELSLENVLREYPGSFREKRLEKVDMHPLHCFRLNFSLQYDPNKIC